MNAVGIIPARLASSRLPRKLLLNETGKPLIQHTWEVACRTKSLSEVIIAVDSLELAEAVQKFGARCEMTGEHPSGTDRVAEVAARLDPAVDVLVNVQGDEPELDPNCIDQLVDLMAAESQPEMATLATPIRCEQQVFDPSCVKVACANDGRALYFSRATIPHSRDRSPAELLANNESPWKLHLGIYAYRREFLSQLTKLPPSPLEQLEKLEQLRALEAGAEIRIGEVDHPAAGIDTPDDYAAFVLRHRGSKKIAA